MERETEIFREWIKAMEEIGALSFPITDKERRKLKIESWRVKALFRDAYERYQQRNRDDGSGKGTGRAQAPSR